MSRGRLGGRYTAAGSATNQCQHQATPSLWSEVSATSSFHHSHTHILLYIIKCPKHHNPATCEWRGTVRLLIAFSTSPGHVSQEGTYGQHSEGVCMSALATGLREPDASILDVLTAVNSEMAKSITQLNKQNPYLLPKAENQGRIGIKSKAAKSATSQCPHQVTPSVVVRGIGNMNMHLSSFSSQLSFFHLSRTHIHLCHTCKNITSSTKLK